MKTTLLYLPIIILATTLISCTDQLKRKLSFENVSLPNEIEELKAFSEQDKYDDLVRDIDTSSDLTEVYSLDYEDGFANRAKVYALLNENKTIQKLTLKEAFYNGVLINTNFYFTNSQLIFCRQTISNMLDAKFKEGEVKTYFGNQQKVIYSASRNAKSKEDLAGMPFMVCKKIPFDKKKAMEIINQLGPYQTKFLGTLNTEELRFLVVGTSGPKGQKSSIAFNNDFPLANEISSNVSTYKNKRLIINFEVNEDNPQFKYQVLTGIKIAL